MSAGASQIRDDLRFQSGRTPLLATARAMKFFKHMPAAANDLCPLGAKYLPFAL